MWIEFFKGIPQWVYGSGFTAIVGLVVWYLTKKKYEDSKARSEDVDTDEKERTYINKRYADLLKRVIEAEKTVDEQDAKLQTQSRENYQLKLIVTDLKAEITMLRTIRS